MDSYKVVVRDPSGQEVHEQNNLSLVRATEVASDLDWKNGFIISIIRED